MNLFLEDDEIELTLNEEELWLIHDAFHYHDSGEMSKDLIQKAWYAILEMNDGKIDKVPFILSKEEVILILDRIPSKQTDAAHNLLISCIRALWQLEYGIRVLSSEPDNEEEKKDNLQVFKHGLRKRSKKERSIATSEIKSTASP